MNKLTSGQRMVLLLEDQQLSIGEYIQEVVICEYIEEVVISEYDVRKNVLINATLEED